VIAQDEYNNAFNASPQTFVANDYDNQEGRVFNNTPALPDRSNSSLVEPTPIQNTVVSMGDIGQDRSFFSSNPPTNNDLGKTVVSID
jgi:hypothetical protein